MKGKIQEQSSMEPERDPLLNLRLSNNGVNVESMLELNVLDLHSPGILKSSNNDVDAMKEEK